MPACEAARPRCRLLIVASLLTVAAGRDVAEAVAPLALYQVQASVALRVSGRNHSANNGAKLLATSRAAPVNDTATEIANKTPASAANADTSGSDDTVNKKATGPLEVASALAHSWLDPLPDGEDASDKKKGEIFAAVMVLMLVLCCWAGSVVAIGIWVVRDFPAEAREAGSRCVRRTANCGVYVAGTTTSCVTGVVGGVLAAPGVVGEIATGNTSSSTRRWVQI